MPMFNIRLATEADMPCLLQIAEAGCPDNDFFFPTKAIPGYFECAWKNRIMTCMYEPHYGSLVLAAEANGIIASWGIFTMADQGNPAEAVSKVASVIRTHFGGARPPKPASPDYGEDVGRMNRRHPALGRDVAFQRARAREFQGFFARQQVARAWEMDFVGTDPKYQRKGAALALVQKMVDIADQDRLWCHANAYDQRSEELFVKAGFKKHTMLEAEDVEEAVSFASMTRAAGGN